MTMGDILVTHCTVCYTKTYLLCFLKKHVEMFKQKITRKNTLDISQV